MATEGHDPLREVVRWMDVQLKEAKDEVQSAEKEERHFGGFEDCGDFYREKLVEAKTRFDTLLKTKIGIDKYRRRLRHEAREEAQQISSPTMP